MCLGKGYDAQPPSISQSPPPKLSSSSDKERLAPFEVWRQLIMPIAAHHRVVFCKEQLPEVKTDQIKPETADSRDL